MKFPTKRSNWMPYLVIAILGYIFGSLSPPQIFSQTAKMVSPFRSLGEEVEEEEKEEKEEEFDLTSVNER